MEVKKLDFKKLAIAIAILLLVILLIVLIFKPKKENLKLGEFEKIAVYGYLENDLFDVSTLYQMSGKSDFDELQIFQSKLKQALDSYFSSHSETEVSTSTITGLIDSKYVPDNLDFHGIIVSDYEFKPETDTFVKSIGANANIAGIEAEINSIDYSDKKVSIQNIEKNADNKYKVTFNIVDSKFDTNNVEDTGEAILSIQDNELKIDSCIIND